MFLWTVRGRTSLRGQMGIRAIAKNRDGESEPSESGCQAHWYALFQWTRGGFITLWCHLSRERSYVPWRPVVEGRGRMPTNTI